MAAKETKELAVGLIALSALLVKHFKDGVQLGKDASAVMAELSANPELKLKLEEAYKGVSAIPAEVKVITVGDGFDIINGLIPEIKNLIAAIQAPKV